MANEKETKNKKEVKNKKSFFKDFKAELKKVIWPTPKQLVNNTIAVVVIVIITAAIVFVLDVAFDLLNKYGINNLKSHIRGYNTVEITDDHEHDHDHDHDHEGEEENASENTVDNNTAVENNVAAEEVTANE